MVVNKNNCMCSVVVNKRIYMFVVGAINAPNFPMWRMTGYEIYKYKLNFRSKKINIVTKEVYGSE
jgi:hypothetical protein